MPRHFESAALVPASTDSVFNYIDDHERLSSHMSQSSWMMGGGRMDVQLDEGRGRRLGSRIRMSGRAFGLDLSLEELISAYEPPLHKAWETLGESRLLIIGQYRMGFDISAHDNGSKLRVFIDYELPRSTPLDGWSQDWLRGTRAGVRSAWWTTPSPTSQRLRRRSHRRFRLSSAAG